MGSDLDITGRIIFAVMKVIGIFLIINSPILGTSSLLGGLYEVNLLKNIYDILGFICNLFDIVMNMYKYYVINVDACGGKHGVARWTSKNTVVAK